MEIKLNSIITGIGRKPFVDIDGHELTLKQALLYSLVAPMNAHEPKKSAEETLKLRRLFDKIDQAEDVVDLKSEEIVKLKELVAQRSNQEIVSGKVLDLLEPEK